MLKFSTTDYLDKEAFIRLIPKNFVSVSDFMIEVLKEYSLNIAIDFNTSLHYFVDKFLKKE